MELLIAITAGIFITLLVIIINQLVFSRKNMIERRLETIKPLVGANIEEDEFRKSFLDRVGTPIYQKFLSLLAIMTPQSIKDYYDTIIYKSGNYKKKTPSNILALQFIYSVILMIIIGVLFSISGKNGTFFVIIAGLIGFVLPMLQVRTKANNRSTEIQNKLPDILDLLYVSVEAGLGFDMALKKSTEKIKGELSNELKWALDDIAKGRDRVEALRAIVKRTGVDDLNSFITAVIQAEQLGSNIANMLRIQSRTMKQKRKQRAEEKSMKLPVKMIFPLLFFMFPAIFIVVLGPAALSAMDSLRGIL
ncbi:MAG: tight adherence protein C [Fusobacteria bacterium]|nr:MAG: tight adherence protein C [Fusobacteriota bacterium]KAF0229766.1 MAG: tight adherence protein [Fusobacteriota bacterium]